VYKERFMATTFGFDELTQRLLAMLPAGSEAASDDLRKTFRAALEAGLARIDLVSREEFEVQQAVLARTRSKLESLEAEVAALEQRLGARAP